MTILNQYTVSQTSALANVIVFLLLPSSIVFIMIGVSTAFERNDFRKCALMLICALLCIGAIVPVVKCCTVEHTRIEATIRQDVSFAEIVQKYDLIEQKGLIWVLQEKEEVSE